MPNKTLITLVLTLLSTAAVADRGDLFSIGTTGNSPGHPATFDGTSGNNSAGLSTNSLPIRAGDPDTWIIANSDFPGYAIRHTVPEVRLQFSVVDERGRSVTTLTPNDFRVLDDQVPVRRIRQFSRVDDLPLQIGILFDVSDSMRKVIVSEKLATRHFLQRVLRPETDRAFLLAFGADVQYWQPATSDRGELQQAVDRAHQQSYATNLYDSVFYACFDRFPQSGDREVVQRALLILSDGNDTGSFHGPSEVIALAQRYEIQIYALTFHARRGLVEGDEVLRKLADQTGGAFFVANSDGDLPGIFDEIENAMRTQYMVSFQPKERTPGFHALRLELLDPQKLRFHARQGYYASAP